MKQKIFLLILMVGTLFSCKEDRGEITFLDNQELAISLPASLAFSGDRSGLILDTILLRSEASWRAYVLEVADTETWCSVSIGGEVAPSVSASAVISGYGRFLVVAEKNRTFAERVCTIIIESYDSEYTITVTQAADVELVIGDPMFKAHLVLNKYINTNNDDKISLSEARTVGESVYQPLDLSSSGIKSLVGIEYFTNVTVLDCSDNELDALDVSKNVALTRLVCSDNKIATLDVTKNEGLINLNCSGNALTTLDVTKNEGLINLNCSGNALTTLDITKNEGLTDLNCSDNVLAALDITKNEGLTDLNCSDNALTALDISKNRELSSLICSDNALAALDITENYNLRTLRCNPMNGTGTVNLLLKIIRNPWHYFDHLDKPDDTTMEGPTYN